MRSLRLVLGITGLACVAVGVHTAADSARSVARASASALSQAETQALSDATKFVNWETPHVHPIDLTPDGDTLLAVNLPDNRLEVFDLSAGTRPVLTASIPVGLDPVSVRARTNTEAWVVNRISDTVSIVDLSAGNVVRTIETADEPADVVFAGSPERAFVSCSEANLIQVFDPATLTLPIAPIDEIEILGEEPRALATDGSTVFAAIFKSGNRTTILGGGLTINNGFPPNVVNHADGPYNGVNPPPNDGAAFKPPQNPNNPAPPAVGLIVRGNDQGQWMDDNGGDWTDFVSGANAAESGRPIGWDLYDHDLAKIDASALSVTYETGLMNICMALGVHPVSGHVSVVGTEATNEIRFEPVVNGRFLRVNAALVDPAGVAPTTIVDLNGHLTYTSVVPFQPIPQSERDKSLGDPRAIAWSDDGSRGYVAGMGSNNVIVIDASGSRAGVAPTIEVGEGPTGLAFDSGRSRLYVMNKFDSSISVVDTVAESELFRVSLHDATPAAIKMGRRHLYDTHATSGLGHVSCASCHVDARMDGLAWDLGNPAGDMKAFDQNCRTATCEDWHPMKGPMATQTLQDIIGKEPLHWRGDRFGLEEFNGAFPGLQGDDEMLTTTEMQEFEDFLATIHFPPNPFRNLDNTLPTDLPLPGHFTTGRFAPAGQPLPNGDAQAGLLAYRTEALDGVQCVTCHTLPTGMGSDGFFDGFGFNEIPPGPNGEHHLSVVSTDGSTNVTMKIAHLRNQYQKVGFNTTQTLNTSGFGYLHDGSVDSIERFLSEPVFSTADVQQLADVVAFMLSFAGSDLPEGSPFNPFEPPGVASQDTHAAVGAQTTLVDLAGAPASQVTLLDDMVALADSGAVGLVAKGVFMNESRGFAYLGGGDFQADRDGEIIADAALRAEAAPGAELTYTVVVKGTETRIGIDRDCDGFFDQDEEDAGTNPADPTSFPGACIADLNGDGTVGSEDLALLLGAWGVCDFDPCNADLNGDGSVGSGDLALLLGGWGSCVTPAAAPLLEATRLDQPGPAADLTTSHLRVGH